MTRELIRFVPYLIVGLFALALLLFVVSLQQLRVGRTGPYWRIRREAGQRGGRLFLLSIALFGVAIAIAFFSGFAAVAVGRLDVFFDRDRAPDELYGVVVPTTMPTPSLTMSPTVTHVPTNAPSLTPTVTLTETATLLPTNTPSPTPTITNTPTITATPTITPTPTATFETALNLTAPQAQRTPRPDAEIRIIAADSAVSSNQTPIEPRSVFPVGVKRLYFFVSYRNMDDGVVWARVLYREGVPIQGTALLWSLGAEGATYFFFGNESSYPPGNYEVRLSLGNEQVSSFAFTIVA